MTTLSSARASTDTRHRITTPNSQPRHIKLVGLRNGGARVVSAIDTSGLSNVQIVIPGDSSAIALASGKLPLLDDAEMMLVVACPGDDLIWADLIKQIARARGILVTGILIRPKNDQRNDEDSGLAKLRAASDMLVVTSDQTYLTDMLAQLRA